MKFLPLLAAIAVTAAAPASADLFVSGDSNIANNIATNVPNQNFFKNIVGPGGIVIQTNSRSFLDYQAGDLSAFYNTHGFTASVLAANATVNTAALTGASLFIAYAPDDAFTSGEIATLSAYLSQGGHNVLITGENDSVPDFVVMDGDNQLCRSRSPRQQHADRARTLDGGAFYTATLQGPSAYLTGTTGLHRSGIAGYRRFRPVRD